MRGHITQRSKDSYSIKISVGKDPASGKYKSQWFTVQGSKKDAEKKLSELLHQMDTGVYMKPGKTTVADYLAMWLSDYVKPNLSPRGHERYESIVRVYLVPAIGSIPLTQLRSNHLQKHYSVMLKAGSSPRSVRYHHVVLHKALATALKWGLIARNVADGVDAPRAKRSDMQIWDEDEVNQFLKTAQSTQYYALFYVALFTGARRSELLALRWQDTDFLYSQLYINRSMHHLKDGSYIFTQPKSERSRRTIALPPSAFLVLQDYQKQKAAEGLLLDMPLKDTDLVFSVLGKPLRPNTVSRAWSMVAVKAGVKVIRLHDARHTHASLMLKQGIHPKIVSERLGHSTISITLDTYSHVAPGLQEAAAKRFDDFLRKDFTAEKVIITNQS